jgi:hypothetical protein
MGVVRTVGSGGGKPIRDGLPMFVIYESPTDFPGEFVCRRHMVYAGQVIADRQPWSRGSTIEECRRALPSGVFNLGRDSGDESQITEVWV